MDGGGEGKDSLLSLWMVMEKVRTVCYRCGGWWRRQGQFAIAVDGGGEGKDSLLSLWRMVEKVSTFCYCCGWWWRRQGQFAIAVEGGGRGKDSLLSLWRVVDRRFFLLSLCRDVGDHGLHTFRTFWSATVVYVVFQSNC